MSSESQCSCETAEAQDMAIKDSWRSKQGKAKETWKRRVNDGKIDLCRWCNIFACQSSFWWQKGKYEDIEQQGLLLRLPISEDAPVYSIEYCCGKNKSNRSGMCFRGFCENCSDKAYYIRESVAKQCSICEINKSVFFTREETETKLKEMEENQWLKERK